MLATVYVVAWTGGFEEASYKSTTNKDEAVEVARGWQGEYKADVGDTIDVLEIVVQDDGAVSTNRLAWEAS